ncbi:MAG: ABC transporter substrate-binding protein [Acidimicrobiales bacterium]
MRLPRFPRTVIAVALATVTLVACGGASDEGGGAGETSRTVVVGSAPFAESAILANMYAKALEANGFKVTLKGGLGQREVYLPALERGGANDGIDLVPEYVGTLLEFVNSNAGEASGDLDATVTKLRARLAPKGLTVLDPSPAADQNAFAVKRSTAERLKLAKLSDLAPVARQLTLGAGSECPTRPFCIPGLKQTYGIEFKAFRVLDSGGPKTKDALVAGDIDVGLVFSSDGAVAARDLVVLEDDRKLQTVDNIAPAIREDVRTDAVADVLNRISAQLTTTDLVALNKRADVDKEDPDALAEEWLRDHGLVDGK